MKERRYKLLRVNDRVILDALMGRGFRGDVVSNPLPEDVRIVRTQSVFSRSGMTEIIIESDSFDPVGEGQLIPEFGETLFRNIHLFGDPGR